MPYGVRALRRLLEQLHATQFLQVANAARNGSWMAAFDFGNAALREPLQQELEYARVFGSQFFDGAEHLSQATGQLLAEQMCRRQSGDPPRSALARSARDFGATKGSRSLRSHRLLTPTRRDSRRIRAVSTHQARLPSLPALRFMDLGACPRNEVGARRLSPLDQAHRIIPASRTPQRARRFGPLPTKARVVCQCSERLIVSLLRKQPANTPRPRGNT